MRLLEAEVGAVYLDQLHRFADPNEAAATLALRRGDTAAIGFYQRHGRIRSGSSDAMLKAAYDAWAHDMHAGRSSVLVAATGDDVAALNARARAERIHGGHVDPHGAVDLRDGDRAGRRLGRHASQPPHPDGKDETGSGTATPRRSPSGTATAH